ncbi:MAG TPA: winged helix-turn-helix domain-containing protein [Gemmatimonadaceae bacterium]|nr:winged helix-turn-helix domain-containing protein [Gemmatimonadaceae bacterium]
MKAIQRLMTLPQLRAVANPLRQELLELLVGSPLTTHELADRLAVPPGRLYHHIGILERTGLIREVARRQRRGAIERTYRATAREYTVDDRLLARSRTRPVGDPLSSAVSTLFRNAAADVERAASRGLFGDPAVTERVVFEKQRVRLTATDLRRLRRRLQTWLADCVRANASGDSEINVAEVAIVVGFYPVAPAS